MWALVLVAVLANLVLDTYGAEFFDNNEHTRKLLHHLTEEEKLFLFGDKPEDAQFDIANYHHGTREKRSLTNEDINLLALKEHLNVQENSKENFIDPHFVLLKRRANDTDVVYHHDEVVERCYYKSEHASVFACGDVRGLVKSNDSYYFIHPLPDRFHSKNTKAHIIVKRSLDINSQNEVENEDEASCVERDVNSTIARTGVKMWTKHRRKRDVKGETKTDNASLEDFKVNLAHRDKTIGNFVAKLKLDDSKRQKRAVLPAIFVETAVFVDRDLYKHMTVNFPEDTERELVRFVLAMINAVQLIYNDPSLGRPVNFILKRLEILHEDPVNLKRPHDIDRFLSNFCTWQRLENPPGDTDPLHWDHALILTGLDLYVVNKNGKVSSQVVGLAPVAGMCTVTSSCTVNEGRHFESVYVVAHEIGHNLGMRHDGPLADNGCDPSAYIMSPTLGSGKITWSLCSNNYLQKFLDTSQSRCLLDHGSSAGQLDHGAEGIPPGERFDADLQCMLKFGRGAKHAAQREEAVCRDLHCRRAHYTWTSHPALHGTRCGPRMHCAGGECVSVEGGTGAGGWGAWAAWSECASACLAPPAATGLSSADRRCTRGRHDKDSCQGHDKKYRACYAQQCENVPPVSVREFAEQICRRARRVDPALTGAGLQRMDEWSSACAVWCVSARGGVTSRGWSLPDGSRCAATGHAYCVAGACQNFTCPSASGEEPQYALSPEHCERETSERVTLSRSSSSWRRSAGAPPAAPAPAAPAPAPAAPAPAPASACHFHCVARGAGLRLVARQQHHTIQLCHTSDACGALRSARQLASALCARYARRVRRLSGLGVQVAASLEDPDRPCRVACQDERVPHRFYLVNGKEGWFPLGTACGQRNNSYCVSGKCLEFGPDDTPLAEYTRTLPLLRGSRHRRAAPRPAPLPAPLPAPRPAPLPAPSPAPRPAPRPAPLPAPRRRRAARSLQAAPHSVTRVLDRELLNHIISNLKLTGNATEHFTYYDATPEHIEVDFTNPIHISPDDAMLRKKSRPTWD